MTKDEIISALEALASDEDGHGAPSESTHMDADELLLVWINDADIRDAYEAIPKWYA